jgi:hypothetical protein
MSVAITFSRIDWPTSSFADCSESSGMSVGRATRMTTGVAGGGAESRVRSGLSKTSPGGGGVTVAAAGVEREEPRFTP